MTDPESPFIPGAKVALRDDNRWSAPAWQSFEVEKKFKNGRFTLKGRDGQWNAYPPSANGYGYGDRCWHAHRAGDSRYRDGTLLIWDESTDAEIKEGFAALAREGRLRQLQAKFERLKYNDVTTATLDAVEAALALSNGKS
jgi:hypothetical protein